MLLRRLVVGNAARARHDGHTDDVKPHRHRVDPAYRVTSEAKRVLPPPKRRFQAKANFPCGAATIFRMHACSSRMRHSASVLRHPLLVLLALSRRFVLARIPSWMKAAPNLAGPE